MTYISTIIHLNPKGFNVKTSFTDSKEHDLVLWEYDIVTYMVYLLG